MTSVKPEIAFDLDGVLAQPPLGLNVAISRKLRTHPLPEAYERYEADLARARRIVRLGLETLKYRGRRVLPDAREGLIAVREFRTPIIVTARSWIGKSIIRRWLQRNGLDELIADIFPNNTSLRPAEHKLRIIRERGIREHVDDDGSTAYYLGHHGVERVYLREWMLNRGIHYPEQVLRIRGLLEIAEDLRKHALATP